MQVLPLILMATSATTAVAGGVVGYAGAQQQAAATQDAARYNAAVARNNAVAQAQDAEHSAQVAEYNAVSVLRDRERAMEEGQLQGRQAIATRGARGARQGLSGFSLSDVLRADSLRLEREETNLLYRGAVAHYEQRAQGRLNRDSAKQVRKEAGTRSGMIIASGKAQARSQRIGGIGTLLSGVGSAASIGFSYLDS